VSIAALKASSYQHPTKFRPTLRDSASLTTVASTHSVGVGSSTRSQTSLSFGELPVGDDQCDNPAEVEQPSLGQANLSTLTPEEEGPICKGRIAWRAAVRTGRIRPAQVRI
jgi:hypothetical protein